MTSALRDDPTIHCGRCHSLLHSQNEIKRPIEFTCNCGLKKRVLINCLSCHKEYMLFPYLVRKTNYCSRKCYWDYTIRKETKICRSCNKEFLIKSYLSKKGFGLFCSKDCWNFVLENEKKQLKCRQCGKIFKVPKSVYKTNPRYCSKECCDSYKRDYISRLCRNCKQSFKLPRWEYKKGKGSFCCRRCYQEFNGETSIERLVRLALKKLNEPFKQEMKIGKYYADFTLPRKMIVIECDGEYWHGTDRAIKRDLRKDSYLKSQGYKVVRLGEKEIKNGIASKLEYMLKSLYSEENFKL